MTGASSAGKKNTCRPMHLHNEQPNYVLYPSGGPRSVREDCVLDPATLGSGPQNVGWFGRYVTTRGVIRPRSVGRFDGALGEKRRRKVLVRNEILFGRGFRKRSRRTGYREQLLLACHQGCGPGLSSNSNEYVQVCVCIF